MPRILKNKDIREYNADEDGLKWQHSKARDFGAGQKKDWMR